MTDNPIIKSGGASTIPQARNVKYIETTEENIQPASDKCSVKKILKVESLSLLNSLGRDYFKYEAEDYNPSENDDERGFFIQPTDASKFTYFKLFYNTCIRCEIFYIFGIRTTLFDWLCVPILLWASRRISGIAGSENENGELEV